MFKFGISITSLLILFFSIYISILVSIDFFDQRGIEKKIDVKRLDLEKREPHDFRDPMMGHGPAMAPDMMRGPAMGHGPAMAPDMMRGPAMGHDMMRGPAMGHDMMRGPVDPISIRMTSEEYDLIIKEIELDKQRIDLEIQRITIERNKLK